MTQAAVRLGSADGELAAALAQIRVDLELPADFPPAVLAEAEAAAAHPQHPRESLLDIPFLTIDPPGSLDLDQAMHLERRGEGYRVYYAIADVPAFVAPGGAVDAETRRRGQTLYLPDGRIPLHPFVLSEGAASLLPGEERGAYVWVFELDASAMPVATAVHRALVRSRERLDYDTVQSAIDAGTAPENLALLREIGEKRIALEQQRGGASLGRPEQEIDEVDGRYRLERRMPVPAEAWNAQISLLTGLEAARLMLEGRVGILRTMPPPSEESLVWFRRRAAALGTPWDAAVGYGDYLRMLDPANPRELAILHAAATLFRGAGYTAFDGDVPEHPAQAAVAAPYAHTTAPLRRLVDRFVLVVCEALANDRPIPAWAREALPQLPEIMAASAGLAGRVDRAAISAVEAAVLSSRVGERFAATVISAAKGRSEVQLDELAVTAPCEGELTPGAEVTVELVTADIATGTVLFRPAPRPSTPAPSPTPST